jgi:hypothetical protein
MLNSAQLAASQNNARLSTGPRTEEGKARVSRNAVSFGLFATRDLVHPEERELYLEVVTDLRAQLCPEGVLENVHVAEIVSATWRLRRCGIVDTLISEKPGEEDVAARMEAAVDRSRTQAHSLICRATAELRRLQACRNTKQTRLPSPVEAPSPFEAPAPGEAPATVQTPRNAQCPCQSGQKYKRCCGRTAPALRKAGGPGGAGSLAAGLTNL